MDKMEERKRLKRNRGVIALVAFVLLILGAFGVLHAANSAAVYMALIDEDHMTDPGIPYRDLENATYTYDRQYLEEQVENTNNLMLICVIPVFIGTGVFYTLLAMPNGKDDHRRFCDGTSEKKYCPECGLKLSRLEKD